MWARAARGLGTGTPAFRASCSRAAVAVFGGVVLSGCIFRRRDLIVGDVVPKDLPSERLSEEAVGDSRLHMRQQEQGWQKFFADHFK